MTDDELIALLIEARKQVWPGTEETPQTLKAAGRYDSWLKYGRFVQKGILDASPKPATTTDDKWTPGRHFI